VAYITIKRKKIGKCGPCPVFANYTLAFTLQLRKKHGKTSVRVVENCPDIPVAVVQYIFTYKQYTAQHNETEYTVFTAYNQQMHNVFNNQLYIQNSTCFDASVYHHQGVLRYNFGITEELPNDNRLSHQNM
jgi:hypothetical protein